MPMRSISSSNSRVRPAKPIKLSHHDDAPGREFRHQLGKLGPISPNARNLLAKDRLGAGMFERFELAAQIVLLNLLQEGQQATVLQLPATHENVKAAQPDTVKV